MAWILSSLFTSSQEGHPTSHSSFTKWFTFSFLQIWVWFLGLHLHFSPLFKPCQDFMQCSLGSLEVFPPPGGHNFEDCVPFPFCVLWCHWFCSLVAPPLCFTTMLPFVVLLRTVACGKLMGRQDTGSGTTLAPMMLLFLWHILSSLFYGLSVQKKNICI